MTFYDALAFVLRHEGGYSHHPGDKGGETNYGITKKTAHVYGYRGSMKTIPMEVVRAIYREGYWGKCRCEEMPRHALRLVIFDAAVHAGPSRAIRWAQAAAGAVDDGIIGPRTLAAIHAAPDKDRLALAMIQARLDFLRRLSNWWIFKNGWSARIAALRAEVQS